MAPETFCRLAAIPGKIEIDERPLDHPAGGPRRSAHPGAGLPLRVQLGGLAPWPFRRDRFYPDPPALASTGGNQGLFRPVSLHAIPRGRTLEPEGRSRIKTPASPIGPKPADGVAERPSWAWFTGPGFIWNWRAGPVIFSFRPRMAPTSVMFPMAPRPSPDWMKRNPNGSVFICKSPGGFNPCPSNPFNKNSLAF